MKDWEKLENNHWETEIMKTKTKKMINANEMNWGG